MLLIVFVARITHIQHNIFGIHTVIEPNPRRWINVFKRMQRFHIAGKANQFFRAFYLSETLISDFGLQSKVAFLRDLTHPFYTLIVVHDHTIQEKLLPYTPTIDILIIPVSTDLIFPINLHPQLINLVEFIIPSSHQSRAIQLIHIGICPHCCLSIFQEKS